jgi:hypothetical protein
MCWITQYEIEIERISFGLPRKSAAVRRAQVIGGNEKNKKHRKRGLTVSHANQ